MSRPAPVSNVAANSVATSSWANSVADGVNAIADDIYGATQIEIPWDRITGKPSTFAPSAHAAAHAPGASDAIATAAPGASAVGDSGAAGSAAAVARSDHRHARESFGAIEAETSYGLAKSDGSGTTVARANHKHGTPTLPTVAQLGAPDARATPNTSTSFKIYVGTSTPTSPSEGDVWIKK